MGFVLDREFMGVLKLWVIKSSLTLDHVDVASMYKCSLLFV